MTKPKTRRTRGRPKFNPSKAVRRKIAIAAGAGMSHEAIALLLGVSRNTLEKQCEKELTEGAYGAQFELVQSLHRAGKKGNVAAIKAYGLISPQAPTSSPGSPGAPGAKPPPLMADGKKAKANEDAKTAEVGTEWETLLKSSRARLQ